jgi:predicted RND superfamily exporter protein
MRWLAKTLVRKGTAWAVIVVSLLLAAIGGFSALSVDQDDDLLAFLPKDNPEVARFYEINRAFGGLSAAIVGIEVDNPLDGAFLVKLEKLTKALQEEPTIGHALSIANVEDFELDEKLGGIRTDYLVRPIPKSDADSAALRERVMSKDHVVGQLIAADGKSVVLLCFFAPDADPRATANMVRSKVVTALPDHTVYWGGAPFISTYIYDLTQADMKRLIPWAVIVIVLIIVASFRDVLGALLALISTAMGIAMAYGLMGATHVDANIVLSSMPVILFAVGSAYAIHILVRYYRLRADHPCPKAVELTLVQIGPTVLAAGLTTVAGLLSFMAMDIKPMREFGFFTGVGILATLILSLTFIPAVIRVTELKARTFGKSAFRDWLVKLTAFAQQRRSLFIGLLSLLAVAGGASAWRVEARMENAAFFSPGSPPDKAETFLRDRFGGSQYIQLLVEGDLTDPGVLREMQRVGDMIALEDHVSNVTHIGMVLSLLNQAMSGERRLPVTSAQVKVLYRLLQGRVGIKQLVDDSKKRGLVLIKVDTDAFAAVEQLLERVEAIVEKEALVDYRVIGDAKPDDDQRRQRLLGLVMLRVAALCHAFDVPLDDAQRASVAKVLAAPTRSEPSNAKVVEARLARFLRSDESVLEEDMHDGVGLLAKVVVALGATAKRDAMAVALRSALLLKLPDECAEDADDPPEDCEEKRSELDEANEERAELADDLATSLVTPLMEMWRQAHASMQVDALVTASSMKIPGGAQGKRLRERLSHALLDLGNPTALVAGNDAKLAIDVSGVPVLYRGLSKSVTANQFRSLGSALALVLIIMMVLFRSVTGGLLAAVPTVLTLLVVYGLMGAAGLHLDIGTSMLASIIIGAGVDYAVHLLAAWRADEDEGLGAAATRATDLAGAAIWTNALMVGAGFFVLTLGEARPLQNVGSLTAAAMLTAALATFVAVPVLARRKRYGKAR